MHAIPYEELAKIGTNRFKDNGFCGVVAVATACRCTFGKAHAVLEKLGRKNRRGTSITLFEPAVSNLGYKMNRVEAYSLGTVKTVASKYPKGVYMILVRHHILTMVNGKVNDWSEGRALRIQRIYEVVSRGSRS